MVKIEHSDCCLYTDDDKNFFLPLYWNKVINSFYIGIFQMLKDVQNSFKVNLGEQNKLGPLALILMLRILITAVSCFDVF